MATFFDKANSEAKIPFWDKYEGDRKSAFDSAVDNLKDSVFTINEKQANKQLDLNNIKEACDISDNLIQSNTSTFSDEVTSKASVNK